MSRKIQAALIDLLLPESCHVMVKFFNELIDKETLKNKAGFESLLFTAGASVIYGKLVDEEVRNKAIALCGNALELLIYLPFLYRSPVIAYDLLENADFGLKVERIRIEILPGDTMKVVYNYYRPLLTSLGLESSEVVLMWAQRFSRLAVRKSLREMDIYFSEYPDDEWENVKKSFIETVNKTMDETMKGSDMTYLRIVYDQPQRSLHFVKMTHEQTKEYYY